MVQNDLRIINCLRDKLEDFRILEKFSIKEGISVYIENVKWKKKCIIWNKKLNEYMVAEEMW